jgi:hypothetical protein
VREQSVNCAASGLPGVRTGSWELLLGPGSGENLSQPLRFYNKAEDIGETKSLAAAQSGRVTQTRAPMEKRITDGRSTPGAAQKIVVTVGGICRCWIGLANEDGMNQAVAPASRHIRRRLPNS